MANGTLTIINLRSGESLKLRFPKEIETSDETNWNDFDVAGGLKPLCFANFEPQQITIDELCLDNSHTLESVEPTIAKIRALMRIKGNESSPPMLQIITAGIQFRAILSDLRVRREFFTPAGVCLRAFLSLTFDEMQSNGLQIDATTQIRSGNSLSGNTLITQ